MAQRQRGGATLEKRLKAWAITVVTLIPFCFLAGIVGEISGRYIHSGFVVTALLSGVCFLGFYFIVRRQVSIINRDKTRDFIYFLAWVILLFSFMELPRCYTILTNDVHEVSSLTQEDVRDYQFFKVDQLDLDTTKVGRFIDHSFVHHRHNTDIEFDGCLAVPIVGLDNTFLLVVSSESANYTFGDEKDWEKAEDEAASELELNYHEALSLNYYYLEKETDIRNGMLYAASATHQVKHKKGSQLVFLRICPEDKAPDVWFEMGLLGIFFVIYAIVILLIFLFPRTRTVHARKKYVGKSKENIREMLPPEKSLEDCEGACIVETGKNISADYVSQARVGTFGKNLTISVELYKTSNNKLVSSFNTKAQDIDALEEKIRENASGMFADIVREELNR